MNSRERVLTSLQHREPDRVPIDFGAMRSTGIVAPAYARLRDHLGIRGGNVKVYDVFQWLAEPEWEVRKRFGGDVVQLHRLEPAFGIDIKEWKLWKSWDGPEYLVPKGFNPAIAPDGSAEIRDVEGRTIARRPKDGFWFDQVHFPLAEAKTKGDIDRFPWPKISDEEVEYLSEEARRLDEETDCAILGAFGGNILEGGHFDWGYERFMLLLAEDRDLAEYYLNRLSENHIENLKRYLPAVKDHIHIIQVGDDLGMQSGPQMSPKMYRELIKPHHKKIYEYIKENSDLYLFLHSCGGIYELIPDLIEIGVDIINPVQTSAAGMDPARLKREFGKDLTFWGGGVDTQTTVTRGSVKDIRREVEERIRIFAPGGGFVFTQVHNIQADIPPEKVVAIYDTALKKGKYPISGSS
ncbi:MAG: uroporphyrinogen decarboxylase family protein [bacterium]